MLAVLSVILHSGCFNSAQCPELLVPSSIFLPLQGCFFTPRKERRYSLCELKAGVSVPTVSEPTSACAAMRTPQWRSAPSPAPWDSTGATGTRSPAFLGSRPRIVPVLLSDLGQTAELLCGSLAKRIPLRFPAL